ncbi:MAG: biosynthetic-type acetolactate synthase large subunit [bacterium]|nr:biosynthetic-type acetolactate synthase large subunit [bacterium]
MKKTGAQIVIDALQQENVELMFGYPGGSVLDIFDELAKSNIRFCLTRHEQGAVHAADGYARATGKVGVCIATSGPGATNLVTGIATAYMDSVPLVALTGQVPTLLIGNDAFQEADITGITRPITKHNYLVKNVQELPTVFKEAFYIARTGRPGPVLIDIPKDVQKAELDNYQYPKELKIRSYNPTYEGHPKQILKVAEAIAQAKRPIIYAGGGVIISGASKELTELATRYNIPVTTTLLGLGSFPETHPLSLKMLGMHGTQYANYAVMESDLILAIGARFDDRVTGKISEFAPHAKIVHIDIDPSAISKSVAVDIPVVGDCKSILQALLKQIKSAGDYREWNEQIQKWKKEFPLTYEKNNHLKPQFVVEEIYACTKDKDTIMVTDVGQHQMWVAQYYTFTKPRTLLSSGGLGTMGYGFPAAIGAQLGCPEKTVFLVSGDGSIQMNIQEMATAVLNKLPIKIAVFNNQYLGMVRQWQQLFYKGKYAYTCLSRNVECPKECRPNEKCPPFTPDLVKLAEAYGAIGMRIFKPEEVKPALKKSLTIHDKPVLMEFIVSKEENVYPMVPAGAPLHKMIAELA